MENMDTVKIAFGPGQVMLLNLCLAFLMFGVALHLDRHAFRKVFDRPRGVWFGLLSQWLVLPLLTLALIFLIRPAPTLALGMLLVSACPGGNVSNFMVFFARGNAALSVTLTSISSLGCVLVTPLYFTFLAPAIPGAGTLVRSIQVSSADMIWTVVQLVLIPLILGMGIYTRFPGLARRLRPPVRVLSLLVLLGIILAALYANLDKLNLYLSRVFLLVLVHNGLALAAGYALARTGGLEEGEARAISIETGIQNSALALILIFNFFEGLGGMALIAAWWGIWHLISGMGLAFFWRYRGGDAIDRVSNYGYRRD